STLTIAYSSGGTIKDLNGASVNILDRIFNITLLDGRVKKANLRLYVTQTSAGIFVHGLNFYSGEVFDAANDKFIPATASPAFQFLYLPNPVADNLAVTYGNPFGTTSAYQLKTGTAFQKVTVPKGSFLAKPIEITEVFVNL